MAIWQSYAFASMSALCKKIQRLEQGEELLMYYSKSQLKDDVVEGFKIAFPWHYQDTKRSYTSPNLRLHGNNGKTMDFAYRHRVKKHFGYDQLEMHRSKRNKLICLWDPSNDAWSDINGEHNPCLVMVKWKERGDLLDMVATFRKRDVCRRMIGNMVFLLQWLTEEAHVRQKRPGIIIDFSMETQWETYDVQKLLDADKSRV